MPVVELKEVADYIFTGITPKSGGDAYTDERQSGIPFVRSGEITEDGLVAVETEICLKPEIHNGIMRRSRLQKGDVLIAIVGATIGQTGIYDRDTEANINQAIAGVRLDTCRILPKYLVAFLKTPTGQSILDFLKRPVARANINLDEIGTIVIPLPSIERQTSLLRLLENARCEIEGRLAQANALLRSIDDIVLAELGLAAPKKDGRFVYAVRLGETRSERRLDPYRFAPCTRKLRQMITQSQFQTRELARLVGEPISGDWGIDEADRDPDRQYVNCLVIRATEFDNTENLILDNDRVKYRLIEQESYDYRQLQAGDILLEKSGGGPLQPVGRVAIIKPEHLKDHTLRFSNFIMRLRPTADIRPVYLWAFLGMMNRVGLTESMQAQTHGIRNLKLEEYLSQPVPVPPDEVQKKIAANVANRYADAAKLRAKAADLWAKALEDFEGKLLVQETKK